METIARSNTLSASAIPSNTESTLNKASSNVHAAVDSIAGKADAVVSKAKPEIHRVAEVVHKVVDKAAGAIAPATDWLSEQGANLNATQKKLVGSTYSYVSTHPMKSLGMALAAGFLFSRLVRQR